jgi:predicted DNA-binding protein (MmcQ/YjbR family)
MKDFTYLCEMLMAMPGITRDVKWGVALVFSLGGRMVAVTGDGDATLFAFKVDDDRFLELTDRPGIIPAPYMARNKWVQLTRVDVVAPAEARALVERAYELAFLKLTKKLQKEIRP